MPRELDAVAEALKEGRTVEPVTVRVFLGWFDAQRRGINVVSDIRDQLARAGVETFPDFQPVWIEAPMQFRLSGATDADQPEKGVGEEGADVPPRDSTDGDPETSAGRDPTCRISKLRSANAGVVRITPDSATSKMFSIRSDAG